jgi:hypothetical protein
MSKAKVLTGPERKAQILEAGAKLASKYGTVNVTRRMVAKACGCAEGLISNYVGGGADAQKAYARKARALGLELPDKVEAAKRGAKLRAHKPKDARDTRKRSVVEVKAIKRKRPDAIVKTRTTRDGTTVVEVKAARKDVDLRKTPLGRAVTKSLKRKVQRSAESGEFVTKAEAVASPATTVTETVVRKSPSKPRTSPAKPQPSPGVPVPSPAPRKSAARAPMPPPVIHAVTPSS